MEVEQRGTQAGGLGKATVVSLVMMVSIEFTALSTPLERRGCTLSPMLGAVWRESAHKDTKPQSRRETWCVRHPAAVTPCSQLSPDHQRVLRTETCYPSSLDQAARPVESTKDPRRIHNDPVVATSHQQSETVYFLQTIHFSQKLQRSVLLVDFSALHCACPLLGYSGNSRTSTLR